MLYNSLAESHVQYCLSSYGRTYNTHLNKIYKIQLRILKRIVSPKTKLRYKDNELGLFKHCNTLPVHLQFKLNLLKEQFFNSYLFTKKEHSVYTRSIAQNKLCTVRADNTFGERTTCYMVPRLINQLPSDLRNKITKNNYKSVLKKHLLDDMGIGTW